MFSAMYKLLMAEIEKGRAFNEVLPVEECFRFLVNWIVLIVFSPCIRRSSVHEKGSLSVKDMREEAIQAMRLQQSISSLEEDDDDDEQVLEAITVKPQQVMYQELMTIVCCWLTARIRPFAL